MQTYIGSMGRSLASRIAAVAIAMMAAVSTPALALLHGDAHHHIKDLAEHHPAPGPEVSENSYDKTLSLRLVKASEDHAHSQIARALSVRLDGRLFTCPPTPADVLSGIGFVGTASLLLTVSPAGPGPGGAPTRQPRAPPQS